MATETKTTGFPDLMCPLCGADGESADIYVHLNDLMTFHCGNCSDDFDPIRAAEKMLVQSIRWAAVARWIQAAIPLAEQAKAAKEGGES